MTTIPLIFDIDGTLIDSEQLDSKYFVQAVRDVEGDIYISEDWSIYKKVTDLAILTEILHQNDISDIDDHVAAIRTRFSKLLDIHFSDGGICRPFPGVMDFLERVTADGRFTIGIATGGWRRSALQKLSAAGIDASDIPMSTSDDGEDRAEIMAHCLDKFTQTTMQPVYFGDGIWDSEASKQLGWRFVGIGRKLRGRCAPWFPDFSDNAALLRFIETV